MKALIVLSLIVLTGCSTTSRMNVEDLNHFKIDCSKREEQLTFLRRQMPTRDDRYVSAMRATSPMGVITTIADGTYYEDQAMYKRRQESIVRDFIRTIEHYCPQPVQQVQGCVHINESFPSGDAQGARCYQSRNLRPVVNRWEALVDPK